VQGRHQVHEKPHIVALETFRTTSCSEAQREQRPKNALGCFALDQDQAKAEDGPVTTPTQEPPKRRDRIAEKVYARVRVDPATGCWIWTGPTSGDEGRGAGYPRMCLDGQTVAVHKVMWTNENGLIPGRKQLDHKCRCRLCVNPSHLELVTHKENMRRQDAAASGP
jgi:hypothetical protein